MKIQWLLLFYTVSVTYSVSLSNSQTTVGDCWNSGKTNKEFEGSVFYNDQHGKITVSVNGVWWLCGAHITAVSFHI